MTAKPNLHRMEVSGWLPNETLYSLCAREHVLSLQSRAGATTQRLFGHSRQGDRHDIPAHVDTFLSRSGGSLKTSFSDLVAHHTILPFYLPWRSARCEEEILAEVKRNSSGRTKSLLGLMSSRFGAAHPLKYCPLCCTSDVKMYSTTYWHRDHQYPGAWSCPTHFCKLTAASTKANGIGRFLWILPHDDPQFDCASPATSAPASWLSFTSLVIASSIGLYQGRIDYRQLHDTYVNDLALLGYGRGRRQLNLKRVAADCADAAMEVSELPEFNALPLDPECRPGYVQTVLRLSGHSSNPLRHLLFIHWLYGTWLKFCEAYRSDRASPSLTQLTAQSPPQAGLSASQVEALTLIRDRGYSARRAAAQVGVQTETVIRWAAKAHVPLKLRRPPRHTAVIRELLKGKRATDVAQTLGVKIGVVVGLLHAIPDLRQQWITACLERKWRDTHRRWQQLVKRFPSAGITALRRRDPADYVWLYRHDRDWLYKTSSESVTPGPSRTSHVDWHARDVALALEVRNFIAHEQPGESSGTPRQAMLAALPKLRCWQRREELLPRTFTLVHKYLAQCRKEN